MNAPITKPETLAFAREELSGKILGLLVNQLEHLKTPWSMTSEKNQEIALNKMREAIDNAVRNAVMVIATERRPAIRATLGKVVFADDDITAQLTLSRHDEGRHEFADSTGSTVLIIMAQPETFTGGTEKVEAAPDQNALPLESQPEIKPEKDGTFTVYKDGTPMVGGKGFETHEKAEQWLQGKLGVGTGAPKPEAPLPDNWPFKTEGDKPTAEKPEAGKKKKGKQKPKDPPPAPEGQAAPAAPKLEDALKHFKAVATEGGKADADFDQTWHKACQDYPAEFVDEHYGELSSAFADGWEQGTE